MMQLVEKAPQRLRPEHLGLLARATEIASFEPSVHRRYAVACANSGADDKAIESWRRLIAISPEDGPAWVGLAEALRRRHHYAEAVDAAARAVALMPLSAPVHCLHGFCLRSFGRDVEGDAAYETAIELDPMNPDAARGRGQRLVREGDADALLAHAEDAMTRLGPAAWTISQYLIALALKGRREAVAQLLDYDRLMRLRTIEAPEGFASLEAFNAALTSEMEALYATQGRPGLPKIIHKGHRVDGGALGAVAQFGAAGAPASAALVELCKREIADYTAWLAQQGDSLQLSIRPAHARLISEANIVGKAGLVDAHIHAYSWVVGVYYAAAPAFSGAPTDRAGGLEFNPPNHRAGITEDIWPSRLIRPWPGLFAVFPGYPYHQVNPTQLEGARITFTFDLKPDGDLAAEAPGAATWLASQVQE
jgi:hypothetical protein